MLESLSRTLIIGNSGSGKSTLAQQLATLVHAPAIDLDLLHWEADGYGAKRDENAARKLVLTAAGEPRWIIEGVFGWLAEVAVPRATTLIWLDVPWSICRAGLLARGPRRGSTDQDNTELLKWAEAYWDRKTPSSFTGHLTIFQNFPDPKYRLGSREKMSAFLAEQRARRDADARDMNGARSR
jgi:adenylate kinase family enzyme